MKTRQQHRRNRIQRSIGGVSEPRSIRQSAEATLPVIEAMEHRLLLANTIYVDTRAVGSNDGENWDNAVPSLAMALQQSAPGDQIRVAGGTYRPTDATDRTLSFVLKSGVAIYGGYAGIGGEHPETRDVALYPTILSGDIGVAGDNSDNSYHVVTSSGVNSTGVLDGFTVTAGNANGSWPNYSSGGGMSNKNSSSPTLTNCTFSGNSAHYGGGMSNQSSSPTLANCTFTENSAGSGGAVEGTLDEPVRWADGGAGGNAGAVLIAGSGSYRITGCYFSGNRAGNGGNGGPRTGDVGKGGDGGDGGGISIVGNGIGLVDACTATGNAAGEGGYGGDEFAWGWGGAGGAGGLAAGSIMTVVHRS